MNARLADLPNFKAITTPQLMERLEPKARPLEKMLALHGHLEVLFKDSMQLDDCITDAIGTAISAVSKQIISTPVTCLADVADKFRFAATLIEAGADGMLYDEPKAVFEALSNIATWRNDEWGTMQPGKTNPWYSGVQLA